MEIAPQLQVPVMVSLSVMMLALSFEILKRKSLGLGYIGIEARDLKSEWMNTLSDIVLPLVLYGCTPKVVSRPKSMIDFGRLVD